MKIACIGSRSWTDYSFILGKIEDLPRDTIIISGGAKGADSYAEKAAKICGLKTKIYHPDWDMFGKKAGLIRNEHIIKNCDSVIAFWDLTSTGTIHALKIAKSLKKPITIYVK